jgi:hypothetical protein
MPKTKRLLGMAVVGVSVFGVATAVLRRNQTPARTHRTSYHVSQPAATSPKPQPTRFQREQVEQVRDHKS